MHRTRLASVWRFRKLDVSVISDEAKVTIERRQQLVYILGLQKGAIFMTLNDPLPRFQGHAIINVEFIRNSTR